MKKRRILITAAVLAAALGTSGILPVNAAEDVTAASSTSSTSSTSGSGSAGSTSTSSSTSSSSSTGTSGDAASGSSSSHSWNSGQAANSAETETQTGSDSDKADSASSENGTAGSDKSESTGINGDASVKEKDSAGNNAAGTEKNTEKNTESQKDEDSKNKDEKKSEDEKDKDDDKEEEEEVIQETIVLSDGSSFVIDLTKVRINVEKKTDPRENLEKIAAMCGFVRADGVEAAKAAAENPDGTEAAEAQGEPKQVNILTDKDENAAVAGTVADGGLVYILKREKKGWLYVESGEVRGFLQKDFVDDDISNTLEVTENGSEAYTLAQTVIDPQDNPALLHTDTSVYQYKVPDGEDIAAYVLQYEGDQVKPETAVTQVMQYYELIDAGSKCTKEDFEKYAKVFVSPQDIAAGDVCLFANGSIGIALGEKKFLVPVKETEIEKDEITGKETKRTFDVLRVKTSDELCAWPGIGYRFYETEEEVPLYRYTTSDYIISKENTPVAYTVALRLVEAGFSKEAASGIVGNLFAECGGCGSADLNPASYSESGVIAAGGIAGWTDNSNASGFTALQQYAASRGASWTDVEIQTDFLVSNIADRWVYAPEYGSSRELSARLFTVKYSLDEFMESTDAKEAAISFLGVYEDDLYNGTAKWAGYTLDGWVKREVSVRTELAGAVYNAFFLDDYEEV